MEVIIVGLTVIGLYAIAFATFVRRIREEELKKLQQNKEQQRLKLLEEIERGKSLTV
jgi:septation ring formation regulator EzrA